MTFDVPIIGLHSRNAFPVILSGQLHIGMWLTTLHNAFEAQVPGQGFLHLLLIQALSRSHSELWTHSGRHPEYGSPWNSGRQVHCPLKHSAFAPHGDGLHGSSLTTIVGSRVHWVNAFPVNPSLHVQIDKCVITWQFALIPQEPGHGSRHFWLMQAKLLAHSSFIVHSGLQLGGLPSKLAWQEQDGIPLRLRQTEFGPQGDGMHGSLSSCGITAGAKNYKNIVKYRLFINIL